MFRKTLIAVSAAALLGAIGTASAEVEKSTTIQSEGMGTKTVVRKTERVPGSNVVVHKKKVVHHLASGQKVVNRKTVVRTPTSRTVIKQPTVIQERTL